MHCEVSSLTFGPINHTNRCDQMSFISKPILILDKRKNEGLDRDNAFMFAKNSKDMTEFKMKPRKSFRLVPELSSDGDSGFYDDFSESVSSGSQRGMTYTPSRETRPTSTENKKESGFHILRHKLKLGSSIGSPMTTTTHKKKPAQAKENFIQKTKRKLLGKSKKVKDDGATKSKDEENQKLRLQSAKPEGIGGIWKAPSQEMLIDFPRDATEKRHSSAAPIPNETDTDSKNKYCCSSITGSTNCGDVHTFVTRPRSMLRVMYDFRAREENDVTVRRGEMVTVLNKDDQDWWWVENSKLQQGFVPKSYIWPCACYVCQKFVLQRVVNIPKQKHIGHDGDSHAPTDATRVPVCCRNRNGINVSRPLAKTWC